MTDIEKIRSGEIKAAVLDIETTNLKADWGYIVTACLKEVNADNLKGTTHSYRSDDYKQHTDERLVRDLVTDMNKYDLILNWYGSRFDIPFINSRSLRHRIVPPIKNFRRDLCLSARGFGALTSNRLDNWNRFLFGKTEKTRTDYDIWLRATRGQKAAIDYLDHHCKIDVLETEKLYKEFQPLLGKLRRA